MTSLILKNYQIEFIIKHDFGGQKIPIVRQITSSDINYHIASYLRYVTPEFLTKEILPEIDKALLGKPFDDDGGGVISFLKIGKEISTFSDINKGSGAPNLPTADIKSIIICWIEWFNENKFDV